MFPEVGSSNPAIILKVVVLPQPDGPRSTKNSLFSITRLEFFTDPIHLNHEKCIDYVVQEFMNAGIDLGESK